MNVRGILFFFGIYSLSVSFFSILNILYSIYFDFSLNINSYFIVFFISLIFGFPFCYLNLNINKNLNLTEQILLIFLTFLLIPLLFSIPYFLSSYNYSFLDSYFESVSGFTGTGFSISKNINFIDEPLLIWRSSSQWLGGLIFLISLVGTLGLKENKFKPLYLVSSITERGNFYSNFLKNVSPITLFYSILTIFIFLVYLFGGLRIFDAFNLAFTVSSSGGFLSKDHLFQVISGNKQLFILSITIIISSLNILLILKTFSNKFKLRDFIEDIHIISILCIFVFIVYFFIIPEENFLNILLIIASSLSTSGIGIYSSNTDLSLLLILLTIIGGSVFSTSSGLKYIRIYILFKTSLKEMNKLFKPLQITSHYIFKPDLKITEDDTKMSFLIFIFFILSIFILSSILTIDDLNFENSFKLSILTLTNTVTSSMYGLGSFDFYTLKDFTKISLIIFMVLGKVELVSFFILIKKIIYKD